MAKKIMPYVCTACERALPKWSGQCPGCQAWSSVEEIPSSAGEKSWGKVELPELTSVQKVLSRPARKVLKVNMAEAQRVLGEGLAMGSILLLGGEPGVGKSTLALQWAGDLASQQHEVIYACGEEGAEMVSQRAHRVGAHAESLLMASSPSLEELVALVEERRPAFLVVDSVQTLASVAEGGSRKMVGAHGAGYESLQTFFDRSRECGTTVLLIGHVTKEGILAGPKWLEHMVDVVLHFERVGTESIRVLTALKNRFGPCDEVGVFEMKREGLSPASDGASLFLDRQAEPSPGQCLCPIAHGRRIFFVHVQALVGLSHFSSPALKVSGYDPVRVSMILAVLEKKLGLQFADMDVYVNVVGGLKVKDTGMDAAVAAALCSSFRNRVIPQKAALFGEVGLTGEMRDAGMRDARLRQCRQMGFYALGPGHFCPPTGTGAHNFSATLATFMDILQDFASENDERSTA